MMKYYLTLKENYKDALLFFRLGDFYEMFFDDAKTASRELDLTLTGRNCGLEDRAPMCGVPYHAADGYIAKLVQKGYKVAICEQLTEPEKGKLVERDVVRVVTPGTAIEDSILDEKKNNYLACICADDKCYSLAWIDVSTGEFNTVQSDYSDFSSIEDLLTTFSPSEVICNEYAYEASKSISSIRIGRLPKFQKYYDWVFDFKTARELLLKQFKVTTLAKFEFEDKKLAVIAAGALINYINETQKRSLSHISSIKYLQNNKYLFMDNNCRRNLEICENSRDASKKTTLLWALDKTRTSMGARCLRRWLEQPLRESGAINKRLDSVEELVGNTKLRNNLFDLLSQIRDVERLTSKIAFGNPSPRDLLALGTSLKSLPPIKQMLEFANTDLLKSVKNNIFTLDEIADKLVRAIDERAPIVMKDGGYISEGYDQELDELRHADTLGKKWLAELEANEKEATGIKNLKVGFNKVFGYYIEVSKTNTDKVPYRYQRKQTLTTGERYITQELKEIEDKLLGAKEQAIEIENRIFEELKLELMEVIPQLQSTSRAIAYCDCLLSLAVVAIANNYVKPKINESVEGITIKNGRHPVVESLLKSNEFVPNDTQLDSCQNRTMIITGPNMSGKSTYMRQVALITLMAHVGSYVPADEASISITDRIFTRIGASDDLAYGQSTFMVEMVEVATILQNATFRSLLILDEIGRGTSTFDGMSIARAVLEDVNNRIRCKTLFSTHYHELTEMEDTVEGIKNFKVLASEVDKGVVFLHKITRGGTNKSFGIEVAKFAGIPQPVIKRAKEICKLLESNPLTIQKNGLSQDNLINMSNDNNLKAELESIDVENLTPMQAMAKLAYLIELSKR
ncbi:MAG: DNA mismatch repair protein MutS [Clostridia bacterium]|nr:DNA mismatch repair protein MutS [Clostridia bacterium]MDE7328702.1 DNA mismatch repair protein MutS [Clostridia bacterium]